MSASCREPDTLMTKEAIASAAVPVAHTARTVIQPNEPWWALRGAELFRYRELLYFLAWRDIKVRYKQTLLGVAWAVIQPLFIALTLTLFLGHLANVPSDGVPYALFAYTAMVPWQLFAHAL